MATVDKAISDLITAEEVTETDLLVLEQNAVAKKLTGGTLLNFLFTMLDGHGGILSIEKTGTSGLVDTYTITLADGDTTKFTVTNGEKGDKGDTPNVWIKYAYSMPTDDYPYFDNIPDNWMGICVNYDDEAPKDWQAYTWNKVRGREGPMGETGPCPDFSVGSVMALDYGREPWVTVSGSNKFPVLNFGLPRGKPGKDGTGAPDWSINNAEIPGHILGRTHYLISDEALITEGNLTMDASGQASVYVMVSPRSGYPVKIVWNGAEYISIVRQMSDAVRLEEMYAFGNLHYFHESYADTGEPFYARFDAFGPMTLYSPAFAGQTVTFALYYAKQVKRLDNAYLDLDWLPKKTIIGTDGIILKETVVSFNGKEAKVDTLVSGEALGFQIAANGKYTVSWNGTEYACICRESDDGRLYLGDPALAGLTGGSGEPFCIMGYDGAFGIQSLLLYKNTEDTETITLGIIGNQEVIYSKIPEGFLPDGYSEGGPGEDGGYYTPVVTQPDADTMQVAYTPSKTGMPTVAPKSIALPAGAEGKTAYQYAQEGGYTGTEEEFAQKLAQELPTALPNPHALTINGQSYDGSAAVEVNISGGDAETETVLSDNLLDKSLMTKGYVFYYGSSGYQMAGDGNGYNYYGFIPLRGAGTYRTKFQAAVHSSTGTRIALVDDENKFIVNATGTLGEVKEDDNWVDFEFIVTQDHIDSGVTKVAFDVYSLFYDQTMIVKDREYPSEFIPFGYIEVATDSGKKQDNILCEKTAVFLGDSICAGTTVGTDSEYYGYGWAGLIGEANRMNWTNYGKNGGTITHRGADGTCISKIADTAISEHPTADYIIFEGGCNDADQMREDGLGVVSSDYATFDTATFSGALESLILKLVTAYPNAKIGYIIPQKMYTGYSDYTAANHIHRKYFDRAVEICQKWGIPVVDLWNGSMLNPKLPTASTYYSDGIQHLTETGYLAITPMIEAWMRNMYVSGAVGGGNVSVDVPTPDWNAAEGEPGHVLNRTHYKKVVTMLKNAVCASDGELYTLPECGSLVVGNTYDITIDGTTYSLKAFELDGVPAIGSIEYVETFDPTLPVPLVFMEETPGVISGVYGDMTAENITVTLITYSYETIPVEYLPKQYHVIPVSSDAWVKTNSAYNITDYDIRDLYSAYKAGYPVYIDIDYGENGTKRIQITGYCFNMSDSTIQSAFEQFGYTLPVFLAGVWHNGLGAEIVTVRINATD